MADASRHRGLEVADGFGFRLWAAARVLPSHTVGSCQATDSHHAILSCCRAAVARLVSLQSNFQFYEVCHLSNSCPHLQPVLKVSRSGIFQKSEPVLAFRNPMLICLDVLSSRQCHVAGVIITRPRARALVMCKRASSNSLASASSPLGATF